MARPLEAESRWFEYQGARWNDGIFHATNVWTLVRAINTALIGQVSSRLPIRISNDSYSWKLSFRRLVLIIARIKRLREVVRTFAGCLLV